MGKTKLENNNKNIINVTGARTLLPKNAIYMTLASLYYLFKVSVIVLNAFLIKKGVFDT